MRRRRWRTPVLWVGCTLSALIALAFVASGWWLLEVQLPTKYGPAVAAHRGMLCMWRDDVWPVAFLLAQHESPNPNWWAWNHWNTGKKPLHVPLYAPFLAVALPTLLVWRFVPKFPRGHCRRCGYNLTGLTKPRCPECGQPFEPIGDAP